MVTKYRIACLTSGKKHAHLYSLKHINKKTNDPLLGIQKTVNVNIIAVT